MRPLLSIKGGALYATSSAFGLMATACALLRSSLSKGTRSVLVRRLSASGQRVTDLAAFAVTAKISCESTSTRQSGAANGEEIRTVGRPGSGNSWALSGPIAPTTLTSTNKGHD